MRARWAAALASAIAFGCASDDAEGDACPEDAPGPALEVELGRCANAACSELSELGWAPDVSADELERRVLGLCAVTDVRSEVGMSRLRLSDCDGADVGEYGIELSLTNDVGAAAMAAIGDAVSLDYRSNHDGEYPTWSAWVLRHSDDRLIAGSSEGNGVAPRDFFAPLEVELRDSECEAVRSTCCGTMTFPDLAVSLGDDATIVPNGHHVRTESGFDVFLPSAYQVEHEGCGYYSDYSRIHLVIVASE